MNRNLTFILTALLILCLLAGCGSKPKNEQPASNTTVQQQTQDLVDQAADAKQEAQEAETETEEVEDIEQNELPEELQDSQEVTSSNADDWTELLCAHPWQAIDDLPDGTKYISIYTFNADGTFTDVGGWYNSELDGEFAGTYEVSEDGVLTITYTEGHDAVLSFKLGFDIETVSLTQIGEEGRFFFHEEGYTTTLSAA